MDDDDCGDALNLANPENKGSPVGSQEHGETISHVPGPDGVVIGVKDVGLAQAVLQRDLAMIGSSTDPRYLAMCCVGPG